MRFGVAANHLEIEGVIGHLCLIGFNYLDYDMLKTESSTRDGFEYLILCGEGVRHPMTFVRRRLPRSMCS